MWHMLILLTTLEHHLMIYIMYITCMHAQQKFCIIIYNDYFMVMQYYIYTNLILFNKIMI